MPVHRTQDDIVKTFRSFYANPGEVISEDVTFPGLNNLFIKLRPIDEIGVLKEDVSVSPLVTDAVRNKPKADLSVVLAEYMLSIINAFPGLLSFDWKLGDNVARITYNPRVKQAQPEPEKLSGAFLLLLKSKFQIVEFTWHLGKSIEINYIA